MKWYIEKGQEGDVVISSRVRLARNLKGYPFAPMLDENSCKEILEKCKEAAKTLNLSYLYMDEVPAINSQMLVERHVISPEMLNNTKRRGLLLSSDEQISILLNEEDHIRIQCLTSGLNLEKAFELANKVDDTLEETLEFGYSEMYGYATCCPTNVGTGLRASCMLHLPALTASGYINSIIKTVSKLGLTVRGLYGEGTVALGNMYQISNQITLGMSEQDSIKNLNKIVMMIVDKEREVRKKTFDNNVDKLGDRVWRAYGILANARLLTSEEMIGLISDVRIGVNMGIIDNISPEVVNELAVITGSAHIAQMCLEDNTPQKRDIKRAEIVREKLGGTK